MQKAGITRPLGPLTQAQRAELRSALKAAATSCGLPLRSALWTRKDTPLEAFKGVSLRAVHRSGRGRPTGPRAGHSTTQTLQGPTRLCERPNQLFTGP